MLLFLVLHLSVISTPALPSTFECPCIHISETQNKSCGGYPFFLLDFTDIDLPQKGLPHTHLRQHIVSFFIGDSSPKREPVQYLAVVQKAGRSVDNVFVHISAAAPAICHRPRYILGFLTLTLACSITKVLKLTTP
jgi:hypothetical protein